MTDEYLLKLARRLYPKLEIVKVEVLSGTLFVSHMVKGSGRVVGLGKYANTKTERMFAVIFWERALTERSEIEGRLRVIEGDLQEIDDIDFKAEALFDEADELERKLELLAEQQWINEMEAYQ